MENFSLWSCSVFWWGGRIGCRFLAFTLKVSDPEVSRSGMGGRDREQMPF